MVSSGVGNGRRHREEEEVRLVSGGDEATAGSAGFCLLDGEQDHASNLFPRTSRLL